MKKYAVGVDFGTLSARAVLIDLSNGMEAAVSEYVYPNGILTDHFFNGVTMEKTTALQHPQDYLDALGITIRRLLENTGVDAADIVGIGLDVTSSTVLPVMEDGTPLCFAEPFRNEPHAYLKLWKHHSAQREADDMTRIAKERQEPWLGRYGGKVSSEWFFPKLLEIFRKAPDVYRKMFRFVEAADWLVWMLTGEETHSSCMAGYKALWNGAYPEKSFWRALDESFSDVIGTKVSENIRSIGTKAGEINAFGAELTGLKSGTAVVVGGIDAHCALPAAGIVDEGKLLMIIGTSTCHIIMSREEKGVNGICGSVRNGVAPGYVAYEAGQPCVGDCLGWFVKNMVPESYAQEARKAEKTLFQLLDEKAEKLTVGESRLLVLDWWNGNRSPFADYDLTGMILGLTLKTKPEEIYRAIIEGTAFGTRAIVDLYNRSGVPVQALHAAGGIPQKNPFFMQIYADVLGMDIRVTKSTLAGAKGSAIYAAVAGGQFDSLQAAAEVLADPTERIYHPNPENTAKYDKLYREYAALSQYFGNGGNDVMKRLLRPEK